MINHLDFATSRSWIEIDLDALKYNVFELLKFMKNKDQFMAVIKADGYGHGAIMIAKELQNIGIQSFAVATLKEAIELRENNIKGNILILGFTAPYLAQYLHDYQLTQTIIDYQYAKELNHQDYKIDVHIKVDSGMHRLGQDIHDIKSIQEIYSLKNLHITGIFSHLCVADSCQEKDIIFTRNQFKHFNQLMSKLKDLQYNVGEVHIQSSYGLINYNQYQYDISRIGIFMYGIKSSPNDYIKYNINLSPVLSIKSRVVCIHKFRKGTSLGYGRAYTLTRNSLIAVIPIGYADGLPRYLTHQQNVLIHDQKVPIIGRLCMDQLLIDITDIPIVQTLDIVTIIGKDINESILVEELALNAQTISNEILSKIGNRLPKIYKKKGQYIDATL